MFNQHKKLARIARVSAVATLVVLGIILAVYGIWALKDVVRMVFVAYLLMLALQKPIKLVVKYTHLPLPMAVFLIYVVFLAAFSLLLTGVGGIFFAQLQEISLLTNNYSPFASLKEINDFFAQMQGLFASWSTSLVALINFIFNSYHTLANAIFFVVISLHLSLMHHELYKKAYWFTSDEQQVYRMQQFMLILEKNLGGNPVIILGDAIIGQMKEPMVPWKPENLDQAEGQSWGLCEAREREPRLLKSSVFFLKNVN